MDGHDRGDSFIVTLRNEATNLKSLVNTYHNDVKLLDDEIRSAGNSRSSSDVEKANESAIEKLWIQIMETNIAFFKTLVLFESKNREYLVTQYKLTDDMINQTTLSKNNLLKNIFNIDATINIISNMKNQVISMVMYVLNNKENRKNNVNQTLFNIVNEVVLMDINMAGKLNDIMYNIQTLVELYHDAIAISNHINETKSYNEIINEVINIADCAYQEHFKKCVDILFTNCYENSMNQSMGLKKKKKMLKKQEKKKQNIGKTNKYYKN